MRFGFTDHLWKIDDNHVPLAGHQVQVVATSGFLVIPMASCTMMKYFLWGNYNAARNWSRLGLNHSFEGNFLAIKLYLDSNQYTVMSYTSHSDVGVWIDGKLRFHSFGHANAPRYCITSIFIWVARNNQFRRYNLYF